MKYKVHEPQKLQVAFGVLLFWIMALFCNVSIAGNKVKSIAVGDALDNRCEINLSQIAKSIEYIPLDNGGKFDGLLTDDRRLTLRVEESGDFLIYQRERGQDLLKVFSSAGQFKSSKISYGRGPGEFMNGVHSIAEFGNTLVLLDYCNAIIYRDGEFMKTLRMWDFYPGGCFFNNIKLLDNNRLLVLYDYKNEGRVSIFDLVNNKIVDDVAIGGTYAGKDGKSIVINGEIQTFSSVVAIYGMCKSTGNSFTCASSGCDTIFAVSNNLNSLIVEPLYDMDFGKYRKGSAMIDFYMGGVHIHAPAEQNSTYSESENHLFFCVLFSFKKYPNIPQPQRWVPIVYDKVKDKTYSLKFNKKYNSIGFVNDIDGGMPFWPRYHIGNKLYKFVSAPEFISMASKSNSTKMKEVASKLTEESNPVLVVVTLK